MSTALYRRYRPETFADVIGQEHVTEPLMAALQKDRVHHAYLFSGPRGCGKTTSARILARCLNCAQGPTPIPCGTCASCVELARGGTGSLDVIEIDAASHGGVDDARDLRERATFAPVRDRYKIFIIDEAHMVTSAGFNALLKIVEEPPEHIKFIFATTEPDKVIGTIRSRTHHYPFRLVPPEPLMQYLDGLCQQEGVAVAPGVLSLVVRAGGGSVRDSLSVLDQLMAGAGESGLDYELAVSLLGYTHASLLDDVVDAVAASDAATVFSAVDRVIQTGHDPRRFVEDLLERFRDLVIINAMPESAAAVLRGMPADQMARLQIQANQLGAGELSRAADITNSALTEMTGATSPRLHLELLCARILLPAADQSERGMAARVDRIERRLSYAGDSAPNGQPPAVARSRDSSPRPDAGTQPSGTGQASGMGQASNTGQGTTAEQPALDTEQSVLKPEQSTLKAPRTSTADWPTEEQQSSSGTGQVSGTGSTTPDSTEAEQPTTGARSDESTAGSSDWGAWSTAPAANEAVSDNAVPDSAMPDRAVPDSASESAAPTDANSRKGLEPVPASSASTSPAPATAEAGTKHGAAQAPGGGQVEMIRRAWPEIMDTLAGIKRATWMVVVNEATPRSFDGTTLELAFKSPGHAIGFNRPNHLENLGAAINKVLGLECQITPIHDASAAAGEPDPKVSSRQAPAPRREPESQQPARAPTGTTSAAGSSSPGHAPERAPKPQSQSTGQSIVQQAEQPTAEQTAPPTTVRPAAPAAPPAAEPRSEVWSPPSAAAASTAGTASTAAAADVEQKTSNPSVTALPEPSQQPDDDSWATQEPPEEAFDPGPEETGWDSQPLTPTTASEKAGAAAPKPSEAEAAGLSEAVSTSSSSLVSSANLGGTDASRPLSRYQQMLNEAAAARSEAPAEPRPGSNVDLRYVEDQPSADDETIEESGLVGRAAIERILNGRLVEERGLDAN